MDFLATGVEKEGVPQPRKPFTLADRARRYLHLSREDLIAALEALREDEEDEDGEKR